MALTSCISVDLSQNFGIIFRAFAIATALLGVSIVQGYLYFFDNNDGWPLRLFVTNLLILDLASTILVAHSLHVYLIQNFGNPSALLFIPAPYAVEFLISAVIAFESQLFYSNQIYKATNNSKYKWVSVVVILFSVAGLGFGLALFIGMLEEGLTISTLYGGRLKVIGDLYNIMAGLCDIIATTAMCTFLLTVQTPYRRTKSVVNYLLFFAVNRGVFVALTQIAYFATYMAAPTKSYWMPFHLSVSKLHINTLLAMLNSRAFLRSKLSVFTVHRTSSSQTSGPTSSGKTTREDTGPRPRTYELGDLTMNIADTVKSRTTELTESRPSLTDPFPLEKQDHTDNILVTSEIDAAIDSE